MGFGRHDRRYNFASSLPEFRPNIFRIPVSYRKVIDSCMGTLPHQEKIEHLEALLYYTMQFGGAEISQDKYFNHPWFDVEKKKYAKKYKVKPNRTLLDLLQGHLDGFNHEHLQRDWGRMKVDDSLISELNEFYSQEVSLSLPFRILGAPSIWEELCRNFQAIPFLKPSIKTGGRLFHQGIGYQMIPKRFRSKLNINTGGISETDISAAALRFLYLSGKDSGIDFPNEIIQEDDSYSIFSEVGVNRDLAKELTYALVFSSKEKEEQAIRRKLQSNERFRDKADLTMVMPEFFEALDKYKEQHPKPHLPLFAKETEFTREILRRSLQRELIVLPIHDSYITTQCRFEELQSILEKSQEELYSGVHPLRFRREY